MQLKRPGQDLLEYPGGVVLELPARVSSTGQRRRAPWLQWQFETASHVKVFGLSSDRSHQKTTDRKGCSQTLLILSSKCTAADTPETLVVREWFLAAGQSLQTVAGRVGPR